MTTEHWVCRNYDRDVFAPAAAAAAASSIRLSPGATKPPKKNAPKISSSRAAEIAAAKELFKNPKASSQRRAEKAGQWKCRYRDRDVPATNKRCGRCLHWRRGLKNHAKAKQVTGDLSNPSENTNKMKPPFQPIGLFYAAIVRDLNRNKNITPRDWTNALCPSGASKYFSTCPTGMMIENIEYIAEVASHLVSSSCMD
jgi:hypothetical protein